MKKTKKLKEIKLNHCSHAKIAKLGSATRLTLGGGGRCLESTRHFLMEQFAAQKAFL